jgi:hypothetical protein
VLRRVQWDAPLGPRLLQYLAPSGELQLPPGGLPASLGRGAPRAAAREAAEAAAVMPSALALKGAGRWDLHHAIMARGGYGAAAEDLGRTQLRTRLEPPDLTQGAPRGARAAALVAADRAAASQGRRAAACARPLQRQAEHGGPPLPPPDELRAALEGAAAAAGLPRGTMPHVHELRAQRRPELVTLVTRMGGFHTAAARLGLACRRRPPARAAPRGSITLESVLAGLREVMAAHPEPPRPRRGPKRGGEPADTAAGAAGGGGDDSDGGGAGATEAAPGGRGGGRKGLGAAGGTLWSRLPSQAELLALGRRDLVTGLQALGAGPVAEALGVAAPPSPARGRVSWAAAAAAAAAAGRDGATAEELAAAAAPGVSLSHVRRLLRQWCEEGRLARVALGRYGLPPGRPAPAGARAGTRSGSKGRTTGSGPAE